MCNTAFLLARIWIIGMIPIELRILPSKSCEWQGEEGVGATKF